MAVYTSSIEQVVAELSNRPDVVSIYQVGSVKHPGISDVDLRVVFADDAVFDSDPRAKLGDDGRYLFTGSRDEYIIQWDLNYNTVRRKMKAISKV